MMKTQGRKLLAAMFCLLMILAACGAASAAKEDGQTKLTIRSFLDTNNNGERGTYEKSLAGVAVTILRVDGEALTPAAEGVTDDEGYVWINDLPGGTYILRATVPEGYGFGKTGEGYRTLESVMSLTEKQTHDSQPFTLTDGKSLNMGIGVLPLCSVSGTVWFDENADGIWQENEPGASGVTISLRGKNNGLSYEAVTGEDGTFSATHMRHGSYEMTYTLDDGMAFTCYSAKGGKMRSSITREGVKSSSDTISLSVGEQFEAQLVGVVREAAITGVCFQDANYNGFYDEGEPVLPGVELDAIRQGTGKTVTTTVSDEQGRYSLGMLRGGEFDVKALLPEGAYYTVVTSEPHGNQFKYRENRREQTVKGIMLEDGGQYSLVVGAVYPASISGTVYMDDNFSGEMESRESVASGLTIFLLDEAGRVVASERTSSKGRFTFEKVNPGTYQLSADAKKDYAFTRYGEGSVMKNIGKGAGVTEPFTVGLDETLTDMDMGMVLPGTVMGEVFADANDNGLYDANESGFVGAVVRLMDESGEVFSAQIGKDGAFIFDAVLPGRYYLRYELPADSMFAQVTRQGNEIVGFDSEGSGDWFDFAIGEQVTAPLCGGLLLGEISGEVYADSNGDGRKNPDETALSGLTMTLTPSRSDLEEISVTTDQTGSFVLPGLRPDDWTLTVTCPEGYIASRMDGTTLPLEHGEYTQTVPLQVRMGDRWVNQILGGVRPAAMKGQVWLDENNDGVMDPTEATPAGETILLLDADGNVFDRLQTDENGVFQSEGMVPGTFTVAYALTEDVIAPQPGDTTFVEENDMMIKRGVTVADGQVATGLNLGIVRLTTLGGQVWAESGDDMLQVPQAQLTLLNAEGGEIDHVITAEDGRYQFTGLLPGEYLIVVALPEGYVAVEPDDERLSTGEKTSIMSDCYSSVAVSRAITVQMAQDQKSLDVGAVLPGRLGDLCWLDLNGNGLQDVGEGGIPGVQIELVRNGEVLQTTISDQYGYYVFENLYPATYTLRVIAPAEVVPTVLREDFPGIVSVLQASGETLPVKVESNSRSYFADLGFKLVKEKQYPAGYGEGKTQDWTRIGW